MAWEWNRTGKSEGAATPAKEGKIEGIGERERQVLSSHLPACFHELLSSLPDDVTEIRLRRGQKVSLDTLSGKRELSLVMENALMNEALDALCEHSLYTHLETMVQGYIALPEGMRVGVCGKAVTEEGRVVGIASVDSINIRLPRHIAGVSDGIFSYLSHGGFARSVLIFSPPGWGKTTILRDLAGKFARPPVSFKVAIIDSRREIATAEIYRLPNTDILAGYPKGLAMEIAVRTMSPEIILCDEIGSDEEAQSLLSVQNCGVPVIATAHAGSVQELLRRKNIARLHEARVFSDYIGIRKPTPMAPPALSIIRAGEIPPGGFS